jgi:hypothetical protein
MTGSLNQRLVQKAIERVLDSGRIVTHFPGQQSFVNKKVNFGFVNLKRKATKFVAPPLTVSSHARSGRGQTFNLGFYPLRHGRLPALNLTRLPPALA